MIPLHSLFEFDDADDVGKKLLGVGKKIIGQDDKKFINVKPKGSDAPWYKPWAKSSGMDKMAASNISKGRQEGIDRQRKIGDKRVANVVNAVKNDQGLRGTITRQHIGKKVGDAANKASQFATKNAGTIGLVGAGAAGAGLLNRRKRQ